MSIDYYCCEICGDSKSEYYCSYRLVDDFEIPICDDCIDEGIEKGNITYIDINSDITLLSENDRINLTRYEYIYKRTENGKTLRLKKINKMIENLLNEREELLK